MEAEQMNIDMKIHDVYEYFSNRNIRWHDFQEVNVEEDYYDWYYAENRLYVIRDRIMLKYFFVKASSPANALDIMREGAESVWSCWEVDE